MKRSLFILCVLVALVACKTNDKKTPETLSAEEKNKAAVDSANFTTLQWIDSTVQDLGKVKDGSVVEVSYRFKNSGNKSLIIEDVVAGCGCTVPEKPEQAFSPGEEGVIRAKFDSKGRLGTNEKYVTVTANTKPEKQYVLHFKVEVTN
jgi:Protein of unknown function (DUF1573)